MGFAKSPISIRSIAVTCDVGLPLSKPMAVQVGERMSPLQHGVQALGR
jgi:hypothetical protein